MVCDLLHDSASVVNIVNCLNERGELRTTRRRNRGRRQCALGLSAFDAFNPHLVFVDLFMPTKDGLETIIEFRDRSATVGIVAVSAGGVFAPSNMVAVASEPCADGTLQEALSMNKVMPIVCY